MSLLTNLTFNLSQSAMAAANAVQHSLPAPFGDATIGHRHHHEHQQENCDQGYGYGDQSEYADRGRCGYDESGATRDRTPAEKIRAFTHGFYAGQASVLMRNHGDGEGYGYGHGHRQPGDFGSQGFNGSHGSHGSNYSSGWYGSEGSHRSHGYSGSNGYDQCHGANSASPQFDAKQTGSGSGVIHTADGYQVEVGAADSNQGGKIVITDPRGNRTEYSGDPHINGKLNFKDNMSVHFGNNTLEMQTKKIDNGTTVISAANLMSSNGRDGVHIEGISSGHDQLNFETGLSRLMDRDIDDGTQTYLRNGDLYGENKYQGYTALTQAVIDARESGQNV